jgi:hypothetical protein
MMEALEFFSRGRKITLSAEGRETVRAWLPAAAPPLLPEDEAEILVAWHLRINGSRAHLWFLEQRDGVLEKARARRR